MSTNTKNQCRYFLYEETINDKQLCIKWWVSECGHFIKTYTWPGAFVEMPTVCENCNRGIRYTTADFA